MSAIKIPRNDLSEHVFQTGVLLERVRAMSHLPVRPSMPARRNDPPPQTTESIADARQDHVIRFTSVLAAMLYEEYHTMHPRPDIRAEHPDYPPSFFAAPADVQVRFKRIAQIAIGMSDPERESLAWHAAAQRRSPRNAVKVFLAVLATASERPEVTRG